MAQAKTAQKPYRMKVWGGNRILRPPLKGSRSDLFHIKALYDATGNIAPDLVADALRLSKTQLAETVGVRRDTFYKAGRIRAPRTQTRVREMVEIVARVKDWAGGTDQALAWYRSQPIPAFGGRTAEAIVKDGKAGALRDYLDHIATGGFA